MHFITMFLGVDHEDLGNITSATQLVQAFFSLVKSLILNSGSLGAQVQALLGAKKKKEKGLGDAQATWHRSGSHV